MGSDGRRPGRTTLRPARTAVRHASTLGSTGVHRPSTAVEEEDAARSLLSKIVVVECQFRRPPCVLESRALEAGTSGPPRLRTALRQRSSYAAPLPGGGCASSSQGPTQGRARLYDSGRSRPSRCSGWQTASARAGDAGLRPAEPGMRLGSAMVPPQGGATPPTLAHPPQPPRCLVEPWAARASRSCVNLPRLIDRVEAPSPRRSNVNDPYPCGWRTSCMCRYSG